MNVIVLMNDTLRADHVNAYGLPAPWTRAGRPEPEQFVYTPHLDQLAGEAALFSRAYSASYPTIPCRYDLFTGRIGFPSRGWEPLRSDDISLPELLGEHGCTSMLVFDTPPLANDDYNFTRGFSGWEWVRGQHRDRWVIDPVDIQLPARPYKLKSPTGLRLYLLNATRRVYERDWMCAKSLLAASEWLERNRRRDGFFLWVDMWDPHDPFDAPDYFLRRYQDSTYRGEAIIYPRYGRSDYMSDAELNDVRARYAAKVTLVDRWVGSFLDTVTTLGLAERTVLIYLSDHGHLFGEHGLQGKPTGPLGKLYEPSIRIPLLIRHPDGLGSGKRIDALVQPCDIAPTVLDCLGIPVPEWMVGKSLLPLMAGQTDGLRRHAVSGRYSRRADILGAGRRARARAAAVFDGWVGTDFVSEPLTVTTAEWSFICPPQGLGPRELFHLPSDPNQSTNMVEERADVARELHRVLINFLEEGGAAADRISCYGEEIGGSPGGLDPDTEVHAVAIDGRTLAYLAEEEAAAVAAASGAAILATTLRALASNEPRALVSVGDQYYWVEDLLGRGTDAAPP